MNKTRVELLEAGHEHIRDYCQFDYDGQTGDCYCSACGWNSSNCSRGPKGELSHRPGCIVPAFLAELQIVIDELHARDNGA